MRELVGGRHRKLRGFEEIGTNPGKNDADDDACVNARDCDVADASDTADAADDDAADASDDDNDDRC